MHGHQLGSSRPYRPSTRTRRGLQPPPDQNVIEISGQGPNTGGTLYLLRKVVGPSGDYRYVPYAPDKPIVIPSTTQGWFSARYYVGQAGGSGERFALWNPSLLDVPAPLARGQVY